MEEVFLRFPHLGKQIFKILSNKNLTKCKRVGKSWNHFIVNDKFCKHRVFYENLQKNRDKDGNTPLHKAAIDGDLKECKLIINHIEHKNPSNKFGYPGITPLHYAAKNGHFDVCKLIIERIKEKNPADVHGWTPLHYAASSGFLDIFKLIIEAVEEKNPANEY